MDEGAFCYQCYVNGDKKGIERIVEMYSDNLIFFINRIINNLDIAEEIMEDTFADLIFHKGRYCKWRWRV